MLTPGDAHDVHGFGPFFRIITGKVKTLLADRGYDADAIRAEIALHGIQAVIPAKRGRRHPALHDRRKYGLRSRIEQLFSKLKNWRRTATRHDKTRTSYLGFVSLASALLWLPFVRVA